MCTEEFIWYQSPEIWAAVIAAASAIITMVFSGVFFYRKHKILANFQKDIDEKKEDLVRTTNELQEKLKVEYVSIYQHRINVIKGLYSNLYGVKHISNEMALKESYENILGVDIDTNTLIDKFQNEYYSFKTEFEKERIYFTEEDCDLLEKLIAEMKTVDNTILTFKLVYSDEETLAQIFEGLININKDLVSAVECKFRELIGVDN